MYIYSRKLTHIHVSKKKILKNESEDSVSVAGWGREEKGKRKVFKWTVEESMSYRHLWGGWGGGYPMRQAPSLQGSVGEGDLPEASWRTEMR